MADRLRIMICTLLGNLSYLRGLSVMSTTAWTSTTVGNNSHVDSFVSNQHTLTREVLREMFEQVVETEVRHNHWGLGCSDLTILAPYFRAISDKYASEGEGNTRLIFDVGANNGDDAESILGAFHKIVGMCVGFAVPFKLISVEPCFRAALVGEPGAALIQDRAKN